MATTPWRRETGRGADQSATIDLSEILLFLQRRWLPIVGLALLAGLLAFVVATVALPERFRATATLVVVPPPFSSELTPEALPLRGFQRLLESDTVLAETSRRLAETEGFDAGERLKVGGDIESRIFVSRGGTERVLAPIIEVVAHGSTPQVAAAKSNVWAAAFLDNLENLVDAAKRDTIDMVEDQYILVRRKLEELEDHRVATEKDYQGRVDALTLEWDERLIAIRQETEDLIVRQKTESRALLEELAEQSELFAPGSTVEEGSDGAFRSVLAQVLLLRIRLAQTPSILVLEKAVSDEGLWHAMALADAKVFELQPLWNRSLITQEVNPVHTELTLRLADVETELEGYASKRSPGGPIGLTGELERLERERSADLAKLLVERAQVNNEAQRAKHRAVAALNDEREVALDRIRRDIANQRDRFDLMSTKVSQAELARAEQSLRDVRLGSPAVAPTRPEPTQRLLLSLGGLLAGAVLGLMLAIAAELRAAPA